MSDVRPSGRRTLLLRVMYWTGFGMRAAAVFLTSVVMFAAMIVIAHSLKMKSDVAPFRPAAGRNLSAAKPVEAESDRHWPDTRVDLGPLRPVATVPSEPVPVVTASPVPDDETTVVSAATGDTLQPSTSAGTGRGTTVVATPMPSGERGPAPEREPPVARREPATQPAPTPRPTPTPAADSDPQPVPSEPEPTPSETESESASEAADTFTAESVSETATPTP